GAGQRLEGKFPHVASLMRATALHGTGARLPLPLAGEGGEGASLICRCLPTLSVRRRRCPPAAATRCRKDGPFPRARRPTSRMHEIVIRPRKTLRGPGPEALAALKRPVAKRPARSNLPSARDLWAPGLFSGAGTKAQAYS